VKSTLLITKNTIRQGRNEDAVKEMMKLVREYNDKHQEEGFPQQDKSLPIIMPTYKRVRLPISVEVTSTKN
jgi:hypothetical protein